MSSMITYLATLLLFLTTLTGTHQSQPAKESSPPSVEVIDLSITLNDQLYPCKVIINDAAERGGPAILFLHGYGECGTDNEKQLAVGLPKHAADNPEDWPFVLIVPQKPIFNTEWEDHEEALLKLLDDAKEQGLYNPDRLAITGLSQGGHGTITLASAHTSRFKAAAPVCGYTKRRISEEHKRFEQHEASPSDLEVVEAAEALADIPTWFVHGDTDSVVPVSESRSLHAALKSLDADTHYTELAGVNHNAWDDAYTNRDLIEWFQEHLAE